MRNLTAEKEALARLVHDLLSEIRMGNEADGLSPPPATVILKLAPRGWDRLQEELETARRGGYGSGREDGHGEAWASIRGQDMGR